MVAAQRKTGRSCGERYEKDMDGEEDKKSRVFFLHICMITEGVWTQVAQVNKFGEPDFHFASSWT
jgi:hypothetical protein